VTGGNGREGKVVPVGPVAKEEVAFFKTLFGLKINNGGKK
jgi:hypothetical protein